MSSSAPCENTKVDHTGAARHPSLSRRGIFSQSYVIPFLGEPLETRKTTESVGNRNSF